MTDKKDYSPNRKVLLIAKKNQDNLNNQQETQSQSSSLQKRQSQQKFYLQDQKLPNINIFQNKIKFDTEKSPIGPRYDTRGRIISYSIVGKPEIFTNDPEDKQKIQPTLSPNKYGKAKSRTPSISLYSQKSIPSRHNSKEKLENFIVYKNQKQVLQELDQLRQQIQKNIQNQKLRKIPKTLQTELLRQENILKNHEQKELQWLKYVERQGQKTNKDIYSSVLFQEEGARVKREANDVMEAIQNKYQLQNERAWENDLRVYTQPDAKDQYENSKIQIIRKPILIDAQRNLNSSYLSSQFSKQFSLKNPKSGYSRYYIEKIDKFKESGQLKLQIDIFNEEVEDLAIFGQKQFDLEYECVRNQPMGTLTKYTTTKEENIQEEEIIEQNYRGNKDKAKMSAIHI